MMATWDADKLELEEKEDTTKAFFVRVKGDEKELLPKVEATFGAGTFVKLGENSDEFGFVTGVMAEGEYEAKASAFPEICHMIRVK